MGPTGPQFRTQVAHHTAIPDDGKELNFSPVKLLGGMFDYKMIYPKSMHCQHLGVQG